MTLIARESIFSKAMAEDPYFNEDAALKSYNLVMKMDTEEARAFTQHVVSEVVWDTIVKNHRTVQGHLDKVIAKRLERVKNSLQATVINKRMNDEPFDEEIALATAGALAVIEKAVQKTPYDYGYQFNENDFRRGPGGRFTTKINLNAQQKPSSDRHAASVGIPSGNRKGGNETEKRIGRLSGKKKAEFQSQYMQIANALAPFSNDDKATLLIRRKGADANAPVETVNIDANKRGIESKWNPMTEDVVGVKVSPKNLTAGGASFNLAGALGADTDTARLRAGQVQAFDENFPGFSNDWLAAGNDAPRDSNAKTYERLRSGSQFLGQVAPAGSKAQMAGAFGAFVGSHGPEAEKIVGPHARKTAYRYRGVTKPPDADIQREYARIIMSDQKVNGKQSELIRSEQGKAIKRATLIETKKRNPKASAADIKQLSNGVRLPEAKRAQMMELGKRKAMTGVNQSVSEDTRTIARNKIADMLQHRKNTPKGSLYELQLQSGHLPPSEGVIVNKNGEVTAQAVGYADDHYLPFNLKQLSALKGGEYIRTRSVGGPTSEDIYTGLMTGAKAVTVVSRSGTFTVDFEPDFKGTRRYNDKAKRMINRYEHLLDAVQSGEVSRGRQVPRPIRDKIYQDVADSEEFQWGGSKDKLKEAQRKAVLAYAKTPEITDADEDYIDGQVKEFMGENPDSDKNQMQAAFRNQLKADKEVNFQLNARGYEAALDSLREQFPYYIAATSTFHRNDDADMGTSTKDRGYVKPKHNRPQAAQAGWFAESINGQGKFNADEADYQNVGVRDKMTSSAKQKDAGKKEETIDTDGSSESVESKVAAANSARQDTPQQKAMRAKHKADLATVTEEVYGKIYEKLPEGNEVREAIGTPAQLAADIRIHGTDSPRLKRMRADLDSGDDNPNVARIWGTGVGGETPMLGTEGRAMRVKFHNALGLLGSDPFNKSNAFKWTDHPQGFNDSPAYDMGMAKPEQVANEIQKRSQDSFAGSPKKTGDMTEAELRTELVYLERAKANVEGANEVKNSTEGADKKQAAFNDFLKISTHDADKPAVQLAISNPKAFEQAAENIQRMRTLRAVMNNKNMETSNNASPVGFSAVPKESAPEKTSSNELTDRAKKTVASLSGMHDRALAVNNYDAVNAIRNSTNVIEEALQDNPPKNESEYQAMLEDAGINGTMRHISDVQASEEDGAEEEPEEDAAEIQRQIQANLMARRSAKSDSSQNGKVTQLRPKKKQG